MRVVLKTHINKTDRNDARGITEDAGGVLSPGACEDVAQPEPAQLTTRHKLLQSKAIAIENNLRATFYATLVSEVGMLGATKFEARIKELVKNLPGGSSSYV